MAFVNDYTEEELAKALAAVSPPSTLSEGPGAAPAGSAAPVGPAVPAPSGAAPAGGQEAGTGFVNLSRYFDANEGAATQRANALMEPLKVDLGKVGDDAHRDYLAQNTPAAPVIAPNEGEIMDVTTGQTYWGPLVQDDATTGSTAATDKAAADAAALAGYDKAVETAKANAEEARAKARTDAESGAMAKGQGYLNDPNKRAEGMMGSGTTTPSSFDSYLTGAALPSAFQGLVGYYAQNAASPHSAGQPLGGRPFVSDFSPARPALQNPGGTTSPGAQRPPPSPFPTAESALDPQQRKRSRNNGGW